MTKVDKVVFLKNPNQVLEHLIRNFIVDVHFQTK